MIDENKLIDFIPSIAIREAIRKENIHYSDYEWYNIVTGIYSKKGSEVISILRYINENTNDVNVKKYTKNQLLCFKLKKYKILYPIYNWLEYKLDFGEDLGVRIPFPFNKGDVLYYYATKDVVTMYTDKESYYKYINDDKSPDFTTGLVMCLYGITWVSTNELIDMTERGDHMSLLELDYIENIYKDMFAYTKEEDFKKEERKLKEQLKEYERKPNGK